VLLVAIGPLTDFWEFETNCVFRAGGSSESENRFARHKRLDACSSGAVFRRQMATP
jgi:hypothetical protein